MIERSGNPRGFLMTWQEWWLGFRKLSHIISSYMFFSSWLRMILVCPDLVNKCYQMPRTIRNVLHFFLVNPCLRGYQCIAKKRGDSNPTMCMDWYYTSIRNCRYQQWIVRSSVRIDVNQQLLGYSPPTIDRRGDNLPLQIGKTNQVAIRGKISRGDQNHLGWPHMAWYGKLQTHTS